MRNLVNSAIEQLCGAFARGGYNPTPIIDLGVLVASADGKVDDGERAMLLDIFQTLLETTLTAEVVDHLVTASLEVIEAAGAVPRARLVGAILRDCNAVEPGLMVALAVAFASEGLSPAERGVVSRIAEAADFGEDRLDALVARVRQMGDVDPASVREALAIGAKPGDA
jgi:tellurite resistance protein